MRLSVIVPMYNEAKRFRNGVVPILTYLSEKHPTTEVILVDDGSDDETAQKAEMALKEFPNLETQLISLRHHAGKGAAVKHGMLAAHGTYRMFIDADHALPIDSIEDALPKLEFEFDIVIGSRSLYKGKGTLSPPWWRQHMGRILNWVLRIFMQLPHSDTQCGFKVFSKYAAEICFSKQTLDGFAFDVELLWVAKKYKLRIYEMPILLTHVGESRVRIVRDSLKMLQDLIKIRQLHVDTNDTKERKSKHL